MSNRAILAVDPGQSGAVAVLHDPVVIGKTVTGGLMVRRDFKSLQDIARGIAVLSPGVTDIVIERVWAFAGQGVSSMFSFGRSTGVAYGSFEVAMPGVPVIEVIPQTWQKHFRLMFDIKKGEEFDSRIVAAKLVPASVPFLKRKLDHGTADAILLACWKLLA